MNDSDEENPGSARAGEQSPAPDEPTPGERFHEAIGAAGEVRRYVEQLIATQIDLLKLSIRQAIIYAIVGVLALLVLLAAIVAAAAMVVVGLSQAIAELAGGHAWVGNLTVGLGFLLIVGIGTWIGIRRVKEASLRATIERYERRAQQQKVETGHNAPERGNS
jgi:hypothetical protein